jgi:hypothetical protein
VNADEHALMPCIGPLIHARTALALARVSNLPRGQAAEMPALDDADLVGVIAALSNLGASLARLVAAQSRAKTGSNLTADALLALYAHDQEIHEARDELTGLDSDGGLPWL